MGIRETIQNKKRYISDYAYSVGSVVVLQGVLQVIIYPLINRWQGAEVLGNVVYYMGIVYILCQSVGYALCQTRLVVRKEYETTNGDYNILGAILATAAALVGGAFLAFRISGAELLGVFVILLITTCRFYCSVEYRLKLNFRLCLFFFSVISAGYLIGTVLYFFTGH